MMRVLIFGLDGATFTLIRPWAEAGELPHLARLMAQGVHGDLRSTLPPVTSPAWPSFMTGKNPGKHGVFDFIRPVQGDFDLVNATAIRAPTLWQILSEAGRRVGVINVPVTYPPRPLNGFMITGLLSPSSGTITYPPDLLTPYRRELGPYRVAPRIQYKEGNEETYLADLLNLIETRRRYALRLMQDHPWDVLMVHFIALDNLQHAFWKFIDPDHPRHRPERAARFGPGLLRAYQQVDAAIGELMEAAGPDTAVIVMSDHGFGPLHYVVNLNLLLLRHGLLRLKGNPWTRLKAALFHAGLTPATVYRALEVLGLQNLTQRVSKRVRNRVVGKFLSFDDVDWSRTVAYAMGHVGQVYINRKDREPYGIVEPGAEYERVRREVIEVLQTLRHPETGRPLVDRIILGEEAAHGPYARYGPDLHLVMDGYRCIAFPLFATDHRLITRQIRGDSGCHRSEGVFIGYGPPFRPGAVPRAPQITDLAPTILHLAGLPVPDDMDGRVLEETFDPAYRSAHPVRIHPTDQGGPPSGEVEALSDEDAAEVEARLRALGYLG